MQGQTSLKNIIADNLRYLMTLYGKSRRDVCNDLDISYTTFCDWINAKTYPRMEALEKLGYYFKVHTRDFFIDIESSNPLVNRLEAYARGLGVFKNKPDNEFSVSDYYATPEGYPIELINGAFFVFAQSSSSVHQSVVMELSAEIRDYIRSKKGRCRVFPGPFDVELPTKKDTVVVPDITVICDTDKVDDRGCKGAPDWIIEVVSPSTRSKDKREKLLAYEESGVREYWIVDPKAERVFTYRLADTKDGSRKYKYEPYFFSEAVPVGIYPGYSICMEELDFFTD